MTAITICSDFGAQKNKVWHCFHCFPIYLPWSDGIRCHNLSFISFKPTFSLSSFTFIKRFFSSSSLSAIKVVVSSAYLRLLIFLPQSWFQLVLVDLYVMLISSVQESDSVIHMYYIYTHTHTHTYILFHILFYYGLSQNIECSPQCYIVWPCCENFSEISLLLREQTEGERMSIMTKKFNSSFVILIICVIF